MDSIRPPAPRPVRPKPPEPRAWHPPRTIRRPPREPPRHEPPHAPGRDPSMTAATQTQGSAVSRAPKKPAPSAFTVIGLAAVVLITLWAGGGIDFTLAPLIYDLTRGEEVLRQFVPNWSFLTRDAVITASLTTLRSEARRVGKACRGWGGRA